MKWKDYHERNTTPVTWDVFEDAFLERFFPRELRKVMSDKFMNLRQGSLSMREYSLKFTQLSKYALEIVAEARARMSRFTYGVLELVKKECKTILLIGDMNICRLMTHS